MFKRKFHKRNEDRRRVYGLRIGDIISVDRDETELLEVVAFHLNNCDLNLRSEEGNGFVLHPSQCNLVVKVKDRMDEDVQKEILKAFEKTNKEGLGFLGSEMKAAIKGITNLF